MMQRGRVRSRLTSHGNVERAVIVGHVHDRHPPCLAHVAQRGADPHRHLQSVAGVRLDGHAAFERATDEAADELRIPVETARRQHHTAAGHDLAGLAVDLELDTDDAAVLDQKSHGAMTGVRLDPMIEAALQQATDQRLSAAAQITFEPPLRFGGLDVIGGALAERGLVHHQVLAHLISLHDPVGPRAELAVGEQRALQRAATTGLSTGMFGVVVGKALDDAEHDGRVVLEPSQHLRATVDECLGELVDDHSVRQASGGTSTPPRGILEPELVHLVVAGNPDHPSGPSGCAAHLVALLEQADRSTVTGRCHCGGETGCTGPQDDHIE